LEAGSISINYVETKRKRMETEDEQYYPQAIYSIDETLCFDPPMPIRGLACAPFGDVKQDKADLTVAVC
jgi:hypothetical protein